MESLVHIVWITGAASVVFAWSRMGLFGGPSQEELDAVTADRDALKKKLDRADVRVDEQKKKVAKLQGEVEAANAETKETRRRAQEHRDECRKLQRQLEQLESRIQRAPAEQQQREALLKGLQEEVPALKARNGQLAAELEEARQLVSSLERDKARLEKDVEAAKAEVVAADDAGGPSRADSGRDAPPTGESGRDAPPTGESGRDAPPTDATPADDGLKAKVRELKEALRIKEGLLRKVRTQAEHNRRAYMITQLQMDLVHDEIYELRHGKPRRDTERSRSQRPAVAAPAAPEPTPEPVSGEDIQ